MKIGVVLSMVFKRMLHNLAPLLCLICGLVVVTTLVCTIPLYADGINEALLQKQLAPAGSQERPPLSIFLWNTKGSLQSELTLHQYQALDRYLRRAASATVGLPVLEFSRAGASDTLPVVPSAGGGPVARDEATQWIALAFNDQFWEHVEIVEGHRPSAQGGGGALETAIAYGEGNEPTELDFWVGDEIILSTRDAFEPKFLQVKIVGRWRARDPNQGFWISYSPSHYRRYLMVTEDDFFGQVLSTLQRENFRWWWFFAFDASQIHPHNVERILAGFNTLRVQADQLLPGTHLWRFLDTEFLLRQFMQRAFFLRLLLLILSIPLFATLLYFVALSSSMAVQRERGEIAVLKSRGVSTVQVVAIYLVEALMLGGASLALGPVLAMLVARLIGRTEAFLSFSAERSIPVTFSVQPYKYAGAAVFILVVASLVPSLGAARHSVVSHRREAARPIRRPWWQRYPLDFLLPLLSVYGYWSLRQRSFFLSPGTEEEYFLDPLLALVPMLSILAAALMFVRLFPFFTGLLARLGDRLGGMVISLSLKQLARAPGHYTGLVFLVVVTVALGAFSGSVARTMDENFVESVYYRHGCDLRLSVAAEYSEFLDEWRHPFTAEFHGLEGVQMASSVASVRVTSGDERAVLLGVERLSFPQVAWSRSGLFGSSLGELMNLLALDQSALLISRSFAYEEGVTMGHRVSLKLRGRNLTFVVVGILDYFPTLYPQDGHFFVANREYLDYAGALGPTAHAWLRTDGVVDLGALHDNLLERGILLVGDTDDTVGKIREGKEHPQRIGLFGILSMGFIVSILLTTLGFVVYNLLSLERQQVQMGILRAIGLSRWQLMALAVFHQAFLILVGLGVGTALGLGAARLFIPFLQMGADKYAQVPPFRIVIAWAEMFKMYIFLGLALGASVLGSIWFLSRMQIYEAVKLGDEQVM